MEIILARPDFDVNWKSQDSSTALSLVVTEINRIPHNDNANAVDRDLKRGWEKIEKLLRAHGAV
jgi:hypothetical protein